eukprot:jgi/Galph1/4056/GphlegSOOS_G2790.1
MPRITLGYSEELRGVFVTEDMESGDCFIRVPGKLAIVVYEGDECPIGDFIDSNTWCNEVWYIKMALRLMREVYLRDQSFWKPYIDMLPSALDTNLISFNRQELEAIQYFPLIEEVERYRYYRQIVCQRVIKSLSSYATKCLEQGGYDMTTLFFWALDMVHSRAFAIPSQHIKTFALLPMMDMINHRTIGFAEFSYQNALDEFEMKVNCLVPKGAQIFLSYGQMENDDWLQFYGKLSFIIYNNFLSMLYQLADILQWLSLDVVQQSSHAALEEKLSLLRHHEVYKEGKIYRLYHDRYDRDINIIIRALLSTAKEWEQIRQNFAYGLYDKPLSLMNELKTWQIVIDGCNKLLSEMKTSIEEDWQLLTQESQLSKRMKLAIQFRREKKKILQNTVSRLKHFQYASRKTGRVTTVWLPPSMKGISLPRLYDN